MTPLDAMPTGVRPRLDGARRPGEPTGPGVGPGFDAVLERLESRDPAGPPEADPAPQEAAAQKPAPQDPTPRGEAPRPATLGALLAGTVPAAPLRTGAADIAALMERAAGRAATDPGAVPSPAGTIPSPAGTVPSPVGKAPSLATAPAVPPVAPGAIPSAGPGLTAAVASATAPSAVVPTGDQMPVAEPAEGLPTPVPPPAVRPQPDSAAPALPLRPDAAPRHGDRTHGPRISADGGGAAGPEDDATSEAGSPSASADTVPLAASFTAVVWPVRLEAAVPAPVPGQPGPAVRG
ncbi:hypothetical protein SQ03_22205, partial [Methylobacterium platani JCM 14648]